MTDTTSTPDDGAEPGAVLPAPEDQPGDRLAVTTRPSTDDERLAATTVDDVQAEPTTTVAVYERPTPLVPGHDMPIIPAHQEMQGLAAMAVTLAAAAAVPKALQGRPNDVFQVLLTARDLGVAVTTGMREFHVIDGRVTLSPKVKLALVNERGRREGWAAWPDPANDENSATWYATRRDRPGLTFSSTFSMDDAKRVTINASGKTLDQKDNWVAYPKRMLSWRALGYLLDDVFPEVGTGLYSPDELGAMTDENGDVIDIQDTGPLSGMKAPRGHGPKAPDEGDRPLCEVHPELCADMRVRLDAIGTVPDARTALVDMWRAGDNALPMFDDLLARHRVRALAMIQGIEGRLRKGEWGSWDADPTNPPPESTGGVPADPPAPDGDGSAAAAEEPVEGGCDVCGAPDGASCNSEVHDLADAVDSARGTPGPEPEDDAPQVVDDAVLTTEVIAEVRAMTKGGVVRELATRQFQTSRDDAANRRALGAVLLRERGGHVRDDQMPPPLAAEHGPDPEPLPLAPADRAAGARDDE